MPRAGELARRPRRSSRGVASRQAGLPADRRAPGAAGLVGGACHRVPRRAEPHARPAHRRRRAATCEQTGSSSGTARSTTATRPACSARRRYRRHDARAPGHLRLWLGDADQSGLRRHRRAGPPRVGVPDALLLPARRGGAGRTSGAGRSAPSCITTGSRARPTTSSTSSGPTRRSTPRAWRARTQRSSATCCARPRASSWRASGAMESATRTGVPLRLQHDPDPVRQCRGAGLRRSRLPGAPRQRHPEQRRLRYSGR